MSWAGSGKYSTSASGKNCNSVSMCCCWLDIFLGQSTHDVVSADRDFYKAIKKYLLIVDNFLLQCTPRDIDTRQIEVHFQLWSFQLFLWFVPFSLTGSLFVRNQAIFSNCEVPGHWTLPPPPVGKWKISVACNKYFSVGCLCVYVSIAPKLSPRLLPVLLSSSARVFRVIVSSPFLYYPTLRYHDKKRSLLRGIR